MENNDTKNYPQYYIRKNDETAKKLTVKTSTFFEHYAPSEYTESYRILCTPSAFAKSTLFYIQEIGKLKSLKSHTSKRESLDSYLYIIVKAGSGIFTYKENTYKITTGDHIFIDCKIPYSHKSFDLDPWELAWVHFNGPLMNHYFDYYCNQNPIPLSKPDNSMELIDLLERLMSLSSNKGAHSEVIASNLLNNLITNILTDVTITSNNLPNTTANKINQIKDYIDNNFKKKIRLDIIAKEFYLSKYHMSREFKKAYGITIANYVIAKKITHAKELLRFTDLQIEEISRICGVEDSSYFNKMFKKGEGMPATYYRKKWKGTC